jgi:acyl-CoA dehydrogenase
MDSLLNADTIPDELIPFKERLSPRFFEVRKLMIKFIQEDIVPGGKIYKAQQDELLKTVDHPTKCPEPPILRELREKAKARGLYNFFLPEVGRMSVLEYSPIAELLGMFPLANVAMNCSAPDTGNMEVLAKYGSPAQKEKWLVPLLNGEIRSAFAMTEPGVASSDATNISTKFEYDAATDEYVINGHKWYISGAIRPECKVLITLGKTRFGGNAHTQQSMLIVPRDAKGVNILRPCAVFGHEHDHAEIIFDNVRVPASNLILGEGKGFEIAQGRLGPGRIHHCMRTIGSAELALAAMVYRANHRRAFGAVLRNKDTIRLSIAEARLEITKCRGLCYLAAVMADERGFKAAKNYIAMIKVAAPRMALKIVDEAIQVHGAHGISQDSKLSGMWTNLRTLRVADGPDIVHLNTIVKTELSKGIHPMAAAVSGINKNINKYGKYKHVEGNLTPKPGEVLPSKL